MMKQNITSFNSGFGVYTARVMLGIDPEDYNLEYRKASPSISAAQKVRLFPNPANSMITIEMEGIEEPELSFMELINVHGQKIMTYPLSKPLQEVSLTGLPRGIYLYRVINYGITIGTGKIIVNH